MLILGVVIKEHVHFGSSLQKKIMVSLGCRMQLCSIIGFIINSYTCLWLNHDSSHFLQELLALLRLFLTLRRVLMLVMAQKSTMLSEGFNCYFPSDYPISIVCSLSASFRRYPARLFVRIADCKLAYLKPQYSQYQLHGNGLTEVEVVENWRFD